MRTRQRQNLSIKTELLALAKHHVKHNRRYKGNLSKYTETLWRRDLFKKGVRLPGK